MYILMIPAAGRGKAAGLAGIEQQPSQTGAQCIIKIPNAVNSVSLPKPFKSRLESALIKEVSYSSAYGNST